jgi:hypothetical protein
MGGFLFLAHTSQIHRLIVLNGGALGCGFCYPGLGVRLSVTERKLNLLEHIERLC